MAEINYARKAEKDLEQGEFKKMSVLAGPLPPKRAPKGVYAKKNESISGYGDNTSSAGLHAMGGFSQSQFSQTHI